MRVKLQKGSEEWNLFMDFWELTQDAWGIEGTECTGTMSGAP